MVPAIRKQFNANFTNEKYEAFLKELHAVHPGAIEFRVARNRRLCTKRFYKKNAGCLRKHCGYHH